MEINKTLFARYADLDARSEEALNGGDTGLYKEAAVALLEIVNECAVAGLEFKVIDGLLCLIVKETKRQTRPIRSYQYPNAAKTIIDDNHNEGAKGYFVAWVVNQFGDTSLHGVLRYTMDNFRELNSVAWFESDAFGDDAEAAERWIYAKVTELQGGQSEDGAS